MPANWWASVAIQTTCACAMPGVACLRSYMASRLPFGPRGGLLEIGGTGSAFAIPAMLHQNLCAARFSTKVSRIECFQRLSLVLDVQHSTFGLLGRAYGLTMGLSL